MASLHAPLRTFLAGLCLLLSACSQTAPLTPVTASEAASGAAGGEAAFGAFTDVPVPSSAQMDLERTLLLGGSDAWLGRLTLSASAAPSELFDFYRAEMPKFGWSEVTVVRAGVSVLTYTRHDRVATVQIKAGRFRGAEVDLTVSPRAPRAAPPSGAPAP